MEHALRNIANNWQLDAVQEDIEKYFYITDEVGSIKSGRNCYVIGRKGTGKSAICQHILRLKTYNIFTESLSFKNFPFNELYAHQDTAYTNNNQYITFWTYLIYLYVCKMLSDNASISSDFCNAIKDIIPDLDPNKLPRTIKRWTSVEFGAQLAEKIGSLSLKFDATLQKTDKPWIERTNTLEDLIIRYCDNCEYYIVFDELDEDYCVSSEEEKRSYINLLKGLFKAVQKVRSVFKARNLRIKPIIFLRDDIYAQISDSDKNKWSDFKLELSWTPEKLKHLLAYRISRENDQLGIAFDNAWDSVFVHDLRIRYGGKRMIPVFDFILNNTHLRPRDVISYLKCCCSIALQNNKSRVDWREVKAADREFSNYFKNELEDEITPLIPQINVIWKMITEMRKLIFSVKDFEETLEEYQQQKMVDMHITASSILEILFNFSILGNQHKTQEKTFFFKYQQTNMTYNRHERLVVHRGLLKSLQLI